MPIHYVSLTKKALNRLGTDRDSIDFDKQIEDIREKLDRKKSTGAFYTGKPLCLVGLKNWFENKQLHLFNADVSNPVIIPGNTLSGIDGAFIALMRYPYMEQKNEFASQENRAYGCARGIVIEQHVFDWFSQRWPGMILPPENKNEWASYCSHDFKICNPENDRITLVDIWGTNKYGKYTKPSKKKSAHLHLQCKLDDSGKNIVWEGVIPGPLYDSKDGIIAPEFGKSPVKMVVWLNCIYNGLPYDEIKRSINY